MEKMVIHFQINFVIHFQILQFLPEALARAFPDQALTFDILRETVLSVKPSPRIAQNAKQ